MEKLDVADNALVTLEEIIEEPFTQIVRDATIQRFEYSFEACWKALKRYLEESEGLVCNSPKSCFRVAFKVGLLDEGKAELALEMSDERNLTSHTYVEAVAQRVYGRAGDFADLMRGLVDTMRARLEEIASDGEATREEASD